jgi:hypothetical protein
MYLGQPLGTGKFGLAASCYGELGFAIDGCFFSGHSANLGRVRNIPWEAPLQIISESIIKSNTGKTLACDKGGQCQWWTRRYLR